MLDERPEVARAAAISVDGRLVKWARESVGLSLEMAAKRAKVAPALFSQWEGTTAVRTPRQLEALADALKRPVAYFFLAEPPREADLPADFRMTPTERPLPFSFETRLAIRRARRLQRVYQELARDLGETLQKLPLGIAPSDPPEEAAAKARASLQVDVKAQSKWGTPEVALKNWRARIEGHGVLVFQFALGSETVSGFSLSDGVPVAVLNKADSHARRVFTLAHEWGHILLGEPGLCDVDEGAHSGAQNIEVYCNAFAASLLVPAADFRASEPVVDLLERRASLLEAVDEAVRTFAVSREVVLRRLLTVRAISRETYRQTADAWKATRSSFILTKRKGRKIPHYATHAELGTRFISRVLAAHERGLVTDATVTDYLALRLKHLSKLQQRIPGE